MNKAQVFLSQRVSDIVAVTILEAQIPYTFYTVNATNNVLVVAKISGGIPSAYVITLTPGNYTPDTICTAITTTNAVVWPTGASAGAVLFSAATYNTTTGIISLTVNATLVTGAGWFLYCNQDQYEAFVVAALANSLVPPLNLCLDPIGAANPTSPADIPLTPGTPFTLPNAIALGGPPYIAIRGDFGLGGPDNIMLCNSKATAGNSESYAGNVLAMIPINTVPGGTITWKNLSPRGGFFNMQMPGLDQATFWLTTGDDDEVLDLNGHPFQFKMGFVLRNKSGIMGGSRFTGDRNVISNLNF